MELDKLIVLTGPSAVGKTTIAHSLPKKELNLERVVTTTTRQQRPTEKTGIDYFFVTKAEFEDLIKNNRLAEWAKYNDHYYGSKWEDIESILKRGNTPLWVTETKGALFFKEHYPHAVIIFLMPANFETLRQRLEHRKLSKEEITSRLRIAEEEMKIASQADYRVVNVDGKVELVVKETADIIRKHFNLTN